MTAEMEKHLEESLGRALQEAEKPALRAVPKPVTLTEQWSKLRSIDQELRKRIRHERLMITSEFDRLIVATNADFDMRLEDAQTAIEADRRKALQVLVDQTGEKLREHDLLARQME
jgi:hypothetical protein